MYEDTSIPDLRKPEWLPRCRRCDTVGHIGYRYCPLCGSRLAQRCQGCGDPVADGGIHLCRRCMDRDGRPGKRSE